MLALAEVAGGHHQQHGSDGGEHRQPVLEQFATALQQRGCPPCAGQDGSDEKRNGGELRVDTQNAGNPDRDGGDPDDQRRIDLNHVDIKLAPRHPATCDIQQPGDVVLQRRAQHGEQDDAENGQQQQDAGCGDRGADNGWCRADRPGLGVAHRCSVRRSLRCSVYGGPGSLSCRSTCGIYMTAGRLPRRYFPAM